MGYIIIDLHDFSSGFAVINHMKYELGLIELHTYRKIIVSRYSARIRIAKTLKKEQ